MSKTCLLSLALLAATAPATIHAAERYSFTRLVDSREDNFSPRTFTSASINAVGEVAFKGTRSAPDGLSSWEVIALVDRTGVITTIVEDPEKSRFQFFSNVVSINDAGEVAFTAFLSSGEIAIFRASGGTLTRIASTAGPFSAFGFDTSLNDAGEVAFTARLDSGEQGLFSGAGEPVTKHYTNAMPVLVDGVPTHLDGGNFGRPSINADGEIAFWDRVNGSAEGIFSGRSGVFRTLGPTDRFYNGAGDRGDANNNDLGIGAFETSFFDDQDRFVTALVTSDAGVLSVVADTLGGFGGFGFYAPAINNVGQVAFEGLLRDFSTEGVFTGPNPRKDAIITDKGKLDGARIISTSFTVGPEALNDSGEVVFIVDLEGSTVFPDIHTAIYMASPR